MALKRLGFSVEEMRRMSTADFIALTDLAFGDEPEGAGAPRVREATQADIDMLLG